MLIDGLTIVMMLTTVKSGSIQKPALPKALLVLMCARV